MFKAKGVVREGKYLVFRPFIKKKHRTDSIKVDSRGRLTPSIRLGRVTDDDDYIAEKYLAAKKSIEIQQEPDRFTLNWINKQYLNSRQFKELAIQTQKNYRHHQSILEQKLTIDGEERTLGDVFVDNVDKPLIHSIAELRLKAAQAAGKKGTVSINRETTYLSTIIAWATNFIPDMPIKQNPLKGYKRLTEKARDRHVTNEEYRKQYDIACEYHDSILPIVFELTLAVAARGCEVLNIKLSDCTEEGIIIHRTKGSNNNIIAWAKNGEPKQQSRLYKAYQAAKARHQRHKILPIDPPLIITRNGDRLTPTGLQSAMQRLKIKMKERGLEDVYWSMHLLKHKALTEAKDKKMAGHKTEGMRNKYDHSINIYEPAI